ncbi:chemotaxis protein CheD [Thermosulfuriphilus ammonigenes]|uniref:Chemotaxis protein CheD n=1 Tax=Thermosulfuriphilus ammonigenes TaxID=1936021 RepID=A0A6G7PWR5_9BACT|nr:chemotaxis protein CheD [Thermosulfuriphilus ammonigenes]MBA2847955.1 chemotaxis protein CheD [Thermosulfuriphilus ammonigenes]QIJ71853.1 chemotaxis protein CheD [Thermosulfuriphilus ammonigenes]
MRRILVTKGKIAVSKEKEDILVAPSIGAGVAVAVYDVQAKVGGLLHALAPTASLAPGPEGLFIDTGLKKLFSLLKEAGSSLKELRIVLAGAGRFFSAPKALDLGAINAQAVTTALKKAGFSPIDSHLGRHLNSELRLKIDQGETVIVFKGEGEIRV